MRRILKQLGLAATMAGVMATAACNKPGATDSELEQDLKQANSSLEMAPQGGGTAVISAIEETPTAKPAASPQRARAPQRATPHATPAPQPTRVAEKPIEMPPEPTRVAQRPSETPAPAPAAEPVTTPTVRPTAPSPRPIGERPGTYKSEAEVLRNLPIPVNP